MKKATQLLTLTKKATQPLTLSERTYKRSVEVLYPQGDEGPEALLYQGLLYDHHCGHLDIGRHVWRETLCPAPHR